MYAIRSYYEESLEDCHFRGGKDIIVLYTTNFPGNSLFTGKALDEIDLHQFFGLRILLVEDNEINLEIAEIFLKDSGFLVSYNFV